jgi:predicted ferric reductase
VAAYLLLALFAVLMLAPVAAAWALGLPARPVWDEAASALALAGFAGVLLLFCLSGRFRAITRPVGIDAMMRFHQGMARPLTVVLLLHPFLYSLPFAPPVPWDPSDATRLASSGTGVLSGIAGWALLAAVTVLGILRPRLSLNYEGWRATHAGGALLLAGFGALHAVEMGRYSDHLPVQVIGAVLLLVAVGTLVWVHAVRPFLHLRRPHRVTSVHPLTPDTWEVTVEPRRSEAPAPRFEAGQFVWLTLDRPPFSLREHPFSIASPPEDWPAFRFAIRAAGDFTATVGDLPVGTRAYLDGPHGSLGSLPAEAPGLCCITGGTGIAPILSILSHRAAQAHDRPIVVFHGSSTEAERLYGDRLTALAQTLSLTVVPILDTPPGGWTGETGPIDGDLLARHLSDESFESWGFVICGPPAMITDLSRVLRRRGVARRRISAEKFSFG